MRTGPTGTLYSLSSAQSRIWFIENLSEQNRAYNDPYDYLIRGRINPEILKKSLDVLIERHEAFRTIFINENGTPNQVILQSAEIKPEIVDISAEPKEKQQELIRDYSLSTSQVKFSLETGPLLFMRLLKLKDDEWMMLLNFHHIICDAVSVRMFLDELFEIYQSFVSDRPAELTPVAMTYREYAAWENEWLKSEDCQNQVEYWKNELKGIPDMLQLPTDLPRPKNQNFRGAEFHFKIDENLRLALSNLSKKHGTSMIVPMLSAFAIMLSRYSSQEDFAIGVPVANRPLEELQMVFGVLINSLPVRFNIPHDVSVSDILDKTRDKFMQAYENKGVPFERLVDELKIKRSLNSSPIFQVLFNYLTAFQAEIKYGDITLIQQPGARQVSQVDITLTVLDQRTWSKCIIQYDTDLFEEETIKRMAGHYLTILKAISQDDSLKAGKVPMLTQKEREQILVKWNSTFSQYPKEKCIHNLFEEQVLKTPENFAVEDDNRKYSYKELNEKSNQLASFLIKKGAGGDNPVALFVDRSVDMVVGLMAIVKSGSTLLPLDPIYPAHRINLIFEDAKPVLVITSDDLKSKLPETDAGLISFDNAQEWADEPVTNPGKGDPQKPAYLLYTSGSTGKPKGVRVKHHSVVNLVSYFKRELKVTEKDVLLSVTTIAFDIAELEMYLPLVSGAKLVVASKETVLDMTLLAEKINQVEATIFQATPVTYKMLLLSEWNGRSGLKVICGGEAMSKELSRELQARCDEVWNGYGPTETAIYSVVCNLSAEDTKGDGFSPIGRPVDNTKVYVLNQDLVPVPVGITGELYIGGDGVSPGYLNLPEITALRFINDHLSTKAETKLYKTGDIVKYYPDGKLVFLNRVDSQVKIRGFRIELGEIESVIGQFPGIRQNVVTVKEQTGAEKILAAYYIPEEGLEPDSQLLKQFVKERLPEYMVPAVYVKMQEFPLTSNNKIDRKLLPEPDLNMKNTVVQYVKPETPTEIKLAEIWESILKVEKIGIHEDFFEAGGHSMIAVTLIIRIEKEFGLRLPLASLFEKSTIHGMAKLIDEGVSKTGERWRSLVPIRPEGHKKPLFLVHGLGLNVLLYTTIVKWLDPEQPVYGLQARGLNGIDPPLETIEEIAKWYIAEIKTVDKEGPYIIAGFSLGGKIAYEMARQLVDEGKEVSFLGLFDAVAENPEEEGSFLQKQKSKLSHLFRYSMWNFRSIIKNEDEGSAQVLKRKMKGLERKITGIDISMKKESTGSAKELPVYLKKVHKANMKADKMYKTKPYKGVVHLFKAKKQTFYIHDTLSYGWDKVALGGVIIHEIPGEHSNIFAPPNDKYFADILQRHLTSIHEQTLQVK